jgi:3-phenylpropionate/trans-cinnamate dioxygenase ferredoxin subunit
MTEFVRVASVGEVPPGSRKLIDFDYVTVALINVDGSFYCIEDVCSHDDGPVAEGDIEGFAISCPRHGANFDIRDGSVLSLPAVKPIPTYEVKVEDGQIFIESPDD